MKKLQLALQYLCVASGILVLPLSAQLTRGFARLVFPELERALEGRPLPILTNQLLGWQAHSSGMLLASLVAAAILGGAAIYCASQRYRPAQINQAAPRDSDGLLLGTASRSFDAHGRNDALHCNQKRHVIQLRVMQKAPPIASLLNPNARILRFLWLATLASELAFWLGISASVFLLAPNPPNSDFISAFVEKLPHGAPFELLVRFLLLSMGAQLLSILVRLNFGDRGGVIPSSIRLVFYFVFFALVMPAFCCA